VIAAAFVYEVERAPACEGMPEVKLGELWHYFSNFQLAELGEKSWLYGPKMYFVFTEIVSAFILSLKAMADGGLALAQSIPLRRQPSPSAPEPEVA